MRYKFSRLRIASAQSSHCQRLPTAMMSHRLLQYFRLTIFLLSTCFFINCAQVENSTQPTVTIPQEILVGKTLTTRNGREISAFVGIPYAEPPIGNLRFASPVAANSWNGTLDASVERNVCPEISKNGIIGDEDCLYLKVYTPQLHHNTNSSLLAVMVYIHGGAFRADFPGPSGPEYLLDVDVVLVTMQYRLGPLGFLSTGDEVASGNWGLKDQVLALKWVQANIRYFGGDPNQVTLFGESAGAASTHILTMSDTANGLFHRYITQSGSALARWAHRPRAAYSSKAFQLGEFVGCHNDTSDSLISCLRTIDFADILATDSKFKLWKFLPDVVWSPTDEPDIEGAILTDSPSNLIAAGKIRDLPWMNGVVKDEGLIFSSELYVNEEMLHDFVEKVNTLLPLLLFWTYEPDAGATLVNATKSFYFNNDMTTNTSMLLDSLTKLIGDVCVCYPAYDALQQQHASAVNPHYFYSFNYRGTFSFSHTFGGDTGNYGVSHADDLIYLFPKDSEFSDCNKTSSKTDNEMVDTMVQLWTSFAINGKPTALALGNTTWEPYSTKGNYLQIGNNSEPTLQVEYYFLKERMEFWNNIKVAAET